MAGLVAKLEKVGNIYAQNANKYRNMKKNKINTFAFHYWFNLNFKGEKVPFRYPTVKINELVYVAAPLSEVDGLRQALKEQPLNSKLLPVLAKDCPLVSVELPKGSWLCVGINPTWYNGKTKLQQGVNYKGTGLGDRTCSVCQLCSGLCPEHMM